MADEESALGLTERALASARREGVDPAALEALEGARDCLAGAGTDRCVYVAYYWSGTRIEPDGATWRGSGNGRCFLYDMRAPETNRDVEAATELVKRDRFTDDTSVIILWWRELDHSHWEGETAT